MDQKLTKGLIADSTITGLVAAELIGAYDDNIQNVDDPTPEETERSISIDSDDISIKLNGRLVKKSLDYVEARTAGGEVLQLIIGCIPKEDLELLKPITVNCTVIKTSVIAMTTSSNTTNIKTALGKIKLPRDLLDINLFIYGDASGNKPSKEDYDKLHRSISNKVNALIRKVKVESVK